MKKVVIILFCILLLICFLEVGVVIGVNIANKSQSSLSTLVKEDASKVIPQCIVASQQSQTNRSFLFKTSESLLAKDKGLVKKNTHISQWEGQVHLIKNNSSVSLCDESGICNPLEVRFVLQLINPENDNKDYPILIQKKDNIDKLVFRIKKSGDNNFATISVDELVDHIRIGNSVIIEITQEEDEQAPIIYNITIL